jgi:UDP-3-O-[3-hydroxymyristoyl] glucosamine N-acyltransferase
MKVSVCELASQINAEVVGDGTVEISGVGPLVGAGEDKITFLSDNKRAAELKKSTAAAVIVSQKVDGFGGAQLLVRNVDAALIETLKMFAPKLKAPSPGVHKTACIGDGVKLHDGVSVGPCVVIDDSAEIGEGTVIAAGCRIGENTKIGSNTRLDSNVVIYHNCSIGDNVVIQANSTIGGVGFGYCFMEGAHRLIPHNGTVVIEDYVELGANCCVDRAKFGETRIGAGTKVDNLVQIAHNVTIGKCCLITSQVGVSGSCCIGDGVVLAGQVGVADNIKIGDSVKIGAQSGIYTDVEAGKQLLWTPALEHREALRVIGNLLRLPKLMQDFKRLTERVGKLEASEDD